MRHPVKSRRFAAALLLAAVAVAGAACSGTSVPADPGLMARMYGEPVASAVQPVGHHAAAPDAEARRLYVNHCGKCHEPFEPAALAAGDWPRYVRKYGPRAGLFGEQRARVLRWLQARAR